MTLLSCCSRPLLVLLLFLCTASHWTLASQEEETCEDGVCQNPQDHCKVYIHASTIPNAGLGIFTAVNLKKDETVGYGDVILPVLDLPWHQGGTPSFNLFADYVWDAWTMGMQFEGEDPNVIDGFSPGLDCAINCHLALINADRGDFDYNDGIGGHRSISPSAGSMTPYHNGRTFTKKDVPAGGELFKYYGDHWFQTREEIFGLLPLSRDYPKAERLIKTFYNLVQNLSEAAKRDLHTMITTEFVESRIMNAIPKDYDQMRIIAQESMRALHQPNATRSLDELSTQGRCLDNIVFRESTLEFAGRGAFATRFLAKGTIVTGSPLVHVPGRLADMYRPKYDEDGDQVRDMDNHVSFHLWLNYCMGHKESSLLLCPYGAGIGYMNHNQTLANIKLQWPPHGQVAHNETWLTDMNPTEMETVSSTRLGMDYVATRDIQDGEELFLDYGDEWEAAWQKHVKEWQPSDEDKEYTSATQWNEENKGEKIRTQEEQEDDPYPKNLMIRCHEIVYDSRPARYQKKLEEGKNLWPSWEKGNLCKILERNDDDGTYTVRVYDEDADENIIRDQVPRELISMIDAPYTTDWHQYAAFRHYIVIPDEMFPEAWKDKKQEAQ